MAEHIPGGPGVRSRDIGGKTFSGKGDRDDLVHQVQADRDALLDPSPYLTRCGQPVLEVYNTPIKVTCPDCAEVL